MSTFIKKLKICKDYAREDVLKYWEYINQQNKECCTSFNCIAPMVSNYTKIIIVGTFTPKKGRDIGYFYCSKYNKLYEILDNFFVKEKQQMPNLDKLKNEIALFPKNIEKINNLKVSLQRYGISILDVIDMAITPNNSASDDKIEMFNLDYNSFEQLKNYNVTFICNSRNAEKALDYIKQKLGYNFKSEYCPQISRRITKEKKQELWNETLKKYI